MGGEGVGRVGRYLCTRPRSEKGKLGLSSPHSEKAKLKKESKWNN
jgi:hypothetical protein